MDLDNSSSSQPAGASKQTQSAPRTKIRASCDACKDSKIRCGQERPACKRCQKYGLTCVYSPSRRMGRPRGTAKNREAASNQAAAAASSSKEPEPPAQNSSTATTVQMPSPSPSFASSQLPTNFPPQDTFTADIVPSPMGDFVNNPNQSSTFDLDSLVPFLAPSQSISTDASTTCMDDNTLTAPASIFDFSGGTDSLPDWTTDTHAQPTFDHDPMMLTNDSANNIASSTLMDDPFALDLSGADFQIANPTPSKDADDARGGCAAALVRQTSTEVTNAAKEQAHEAKSMSAVLGSCEKVLGRLASPCNCGRWCSTRISTTLAGCYAARALGDELTAGMARCGAQGTAAGEDGSIGTDATTAFTATTTSSSTGTRLRFGSYQMEMPYELVNDLFMRRWRLLQAKVEELNELNYLECMDRPLGSPCEEIRDCVLAELRASLARGVGVMG